MKHLLLLLLASTMCAQTLINGGRTVLGAIDNSGATTTKPSKTGTAPPGTCAVGETFIDTDAPSSAQFLVCTATNTWTAPAAIRSFGITIDGGGSVITTGVKGDIEVPFACTINRATMLADQSGSIVIDVWKDTYANYPPTVADTITASAKPTISSATKSQDSTLTGWTTAVTAGDTIRFNVDSATTITRVTLVIRCAL
jgi:hypothetical protein